MFEAGNPGRPKGSVNRINIDIRQKFYKVYDDMGTNIKQDGDTAFLVWARSNKKTFYSLFCKLAPTNIDISDNRQHESFIDRMAQTMLEAEAKVIDSKLIESQSQLPMGNDTNIVHGNGGHMGNDTIDKEANHPIIEGEIGKVVSSDELKS